MLTRSIDEVVAAYPWKPLAHEAAFRQLLGFVAADADMQDRRWVAYLLATIRHETAFTFAPIEEIGHGAGLPYGAPDAHTGLVYYGRGYVQLTWWGNYQHFGDVLGVDLQRNPALALDPATSYRIASLGMRRGMFTGVGLGRYINDQGCDYMNARRVINGTDKAELIAGYAVAFEKSLS